MYWEQDTYKYPDAYCETFLFSSKGDLIVSLEIELQ